MKINKKYTLKKNNLYYSDLNGKLNFSAENNGIARIIDSYEEALRLQKLLECEIEHFPVVTLDEAKEFLLQLLKLLGADFHPDNLFNLYQGNKEEQLFSDDECEELEASMQQAQRIFANWQIDIYEFCLNNLPQTPMQIEAPAPEIKTECKTNLDYNFYLFCQLRQEFLPSKTEYDIQFNLDIENYNLFLNTFNDPKKDLYTCITNFFTFQPVENKPAVNTLQSINDKFDAINEEYIKKLNEVLLNLSECDEIENVNSMQSISEDLDYLAVNYFMQTPDGDYQNECKLGYQISDEDAIEILINRINNSL